MKNRNIIVSENLEIQRLTKSTYIHRSFLTLDNGMTFPCNGLIYLKNDEAIIFDTPTNNAASTELISFLETKLNSKVSAVVINHFHVDCLGGLKAFHNSGIKSYASKRTIEFALADSTSKPEVPQNGFDTLLILDLGGSQIENRFLGEAHTRDNIVSYIPGERVLFGGCMIKEIGAGKGNLADANVDSWSETVRKVKTTYPDVKYVVPGHGKPGNQKLLEYTIEMFLKNKPL